MISHDGTLVMAELHDAGGKCPLDELERRSSPRLSGDFGVAWEKVLDTGRAIIQKSSDGQLHAVAAVAQRKQLLPPNTLNEKKEPHEAVDPRAVEALVSRTTDPRKFSAPYQAVRTGVKARRDPLVEYVESLSPIDRPDFWNGFMRLSDEQQTDLRSRAARSSNRSR